MLYWVLKRGILGPLLTSIYDPWVEGLEHVPETGGAIWFNPRSVKAKPRGAKKISGLYAIILGLAYKKLRAALVDYRTKHDLNLLGFGDLSNERVARLCDIPLAIAPLAKKRDYNEPFFFDQPPPPSLLEKMRRDFARLGMRIIQGGRFYHLVGQSDKGMAITKLRQWYKETLEGPVTIIGLGDSPNDIALFEAADIPVLIKRHDGKYHPQVRTAIKTRLAGDIGPAGWNRAVLKILGGL